MAWVPMERLRSLRAVGRLAADYPDVAPLLAEMLDAPDRSAPATGDLVRAGRLLAGLDPDEVLAHHPDTPVVTAAVTGHSTVNQLTDPLTAELARHGLLLRPRISDHGAYERDLTDTESDFLTCGADLAVCLLDPEMITERLPTPWQVTDVEEIAAATLNRLRGLAGRYAEHATGTLVLNTIPLPLNCLRQILDLRARARLGAVWRQFNAELLSLGERSSSIVVIDLDPLIAEGGPAADPRLASYLKTPYTDALFAAYARELAHVVRALRGMTKKCLVLDLDETLWDGVLGDAGPQGVAAAGTLRGEAFGAVQRTVKQLASQGVLLAISSKNDQAPVLDVLREHPDMVLREDDFACVNANWSNKDGNLRDIAERLGIGVDALVFADDTPAERALVRFRLPHVQVVPLDDEPTLHVTRLLREGWFDVPVLTEEDRQRPGQYRAEAARQIHRDQAGSLADYLRELSVTVDVSPPQPYELARLSQLTLRTNQFNLTGQRLGLAEVQARAEDPDQPLIAVRAADRFGDNGLVGSLFLRLERDALVIDNMLLSCRVFGRGIEQACLSALLEHAREAGLREVRARRLPTAKNRRTAELYPALGFCEVPPPGAGGERYFRHDLAEVPRVPEHVRLTARFEGLVQV
ncbi:HAD-IIIC family phosphatase [Streptomyces sp. E11-3]|uniref:HAD-IIIC family phosphatase n=1 Tax=Streptomyces sp. E11-3 TaxID=3110112 RepID=UPI0039804017